MRLKEARKEAGLSQAELGRRMGIDPSIVRHVEAGRLKAYPRFRRVCTRILGKQQEEIFGGPAEDQE